MPLPLASIRQTIASPVTPFTNDTILIEVEDFSRRTLPEYGTPHPVSAKYPNHKLCFIEPLDDDGTGAHREGMYRMTYAAARESQDEYNWEVKQLEIGGISLTALIRTYFLPREEARIDAPVIGSTVVTRVPTVLWEDEPSETEWLLADYTIERFKGSSLSTGDLKYDSLFVEATQVYVARIQNFGRQYDARLKGTFQTTKILYYRGETVSGLPIESHFENSSSPYWGLKSTGFFREGQQIDPDWFLVAERRTVTEDGSTGSLTRERIESSVIGAPSFIESRVTSIEHYRDPGAQSAGGFVTSVTSEEQEDGTWRNVVRYANSASGTVATQFYSNEFGGMSSTQISEPNAPQTNASGGSVIRESFEVVERGIDNSPAVTIKKTDTFLFSEAQQQQRVLSGEPIGVSEAISATTTEENPIPESRTTQFSHDVAIRNTLGEPILWTKKSEKLAPASGLISSARSVTEYGTKTTTVELVEQQSPPTEELNNGSMGGSFRVVARDVSGLPLLWEKQREDFEPTNLITAKSKKCNGTFETISESSLVDSPDIPEGEEGSVKLVRPPVALNPAVYEKTIETNTLSPNAGGSKMTNEYLGGIAQAQYTLAEGGQTLVGGFGMIGGTVEPIGCKQTIKTEYFMEFGSLSETSYDPDSNATILSVKTVVPAGSVGSVNGSSVTTIEPIDKWHSIQIVRSIASDPQGFDSVPTRVNVSLPAEIYSASFVVVSAYASGAPFSDFAIDFGLDLGFKPSYSGGVPGYITRKFQQGGPPTHGTPLPILRPAGATLWAGYSLSKSLTTSNDNMESASGQATASLREFSVPVSLHDAITVSLPTFPNTGGARLYFSGSISATDPPQLPNGRYVVDSNVRPWRFGWWVGEFTEVEL